MDLRQDQFQLFSKFAHLYDAGVPLAAALDLVRGVLGRDLRQAVGAVIQRSGAAQAPPLRVAVS